MASTLSLLADVGAFAAFDLTETWDLHDPRFGTAGSTEVTCPTCGMRGDVCMGHHASLPLGIHMFHPLLYKEAQQIINSVCSNCGRLLERLTKSKSKRCTDCNIVNHGDYVVYADDMSRAVRPNNNGAKDAGSVLLPDGYVVSAVLVPPIHLRTPEDMEWSTDIHKLYEQLLHAVRNLHNKKSAAALAVNALGQSSAAVKQVCATYTKITGAQGREGIMGVLSGKEGIFRKIMLGKRVEMSARAVIVGDPSLQMDEVAVPRVVSDGVRVRVTCGSYNEEWLKDLASRGRLWWEGTEDEVSPFNVLPGMTFQRGMRNGDYVMLNRQPSLSRQSMTCYRVVLRESDSDVFGLNPQATPPFNADFDGDEMNTFFMSQTRSHQCIAEMTELCKMENVVPVQDPRYGMPHHVQRQFARERRGAARLHVHMRNIHYAGRTHHKRHPVHVRTGRWRSDQEHAHDEKLGFAQAAARCRKVDVNVRPDRADVVPSRRAACRDAETKRRTSTEKDASKKSLSTCPEQA